MDRSDQLQHRDPKSGPQEDGSLRFFPLDALRGLLVVLMALDHTSFFIAQQHSSGEYWGGPFPVYHEPSAFLVRFFTHLAAPGFFLLMGVGMALFAAARRRRGWGKPRIGLHLVLRGGFLIVLQLLLINRAWELAAGGWELDLYFGVLFALGATMMLGSLVLWLKPWSVLLVTMSLILAVELLVPNPEHWGQTRPLVERLLLLPGGTRAVWVNYPVLPWLGLVTFGMVFGNWLVDDRKRANDRALRLGVALLIGFFILRFFDGFGNIRPRQGDTWLDLLNVVKYPPSMTFLLLTTGVNLVILGLLARAGLCVQNLLRPLAVFGSVPLFFYVVHLFLYAAMGLLFTPQGSSLSGMIPYWLVGLLALYPLCFWYGRFKHRQAAGSLWRFF